MCMQPLHTLRERKITKCFPVKELFLNIIAAADNDPTLYLLHPEHIQMTFCVNFSCTMMQYDGMQMFYHLLAGGLNLLL